jgi:hypothetical protein
VEIFMGNDLLDAKAAIDWGESQFPILSARTRAWEASIEKIISDPYPKSGNKIVIARAKEPLPAIINAEVGAIIGTFRSSLDLLAATLARRSSVTPNANTHFPIFRCIYDFIDPKDGLECKKWLSASDIKIIKSYSPYDGGNNLLWALHQLDILRKHERLIAAIANPRIPYVFGRGVTLHEPTPLEYETILLEFPRDAHEPEIGFTTDIIFNEPRLCIDRSPLLPTLSNFSSLVREIVDRFDVL